MVHAQVMAHLMSQRGTDGDGAVIVILEEHYILSSVCCSNEQEGVCFSFCFILPAIITHPGRMESELVLMVTH